METSPMQYVPTTRLKGLATNPRKITNENLNKLCDSIRQNGFWKHRPMAVEPEEGTDKLVVLDGNQRLKAARRLKMKEVPVVVYTGMTEEERLDLILRSNINNGDWETDILRVEYEGVDFEGIGLDIELPDPDDYEPESEPETTEEEPEEEEEDKQEKLAFYYRMLGDYIYPSDNQYEIPTLLSDNQPVHLELPFSPWGVESRHKMGMTTYHFYVDDYRFEQLFKNPILLLTSGCRAIVEPNVSIHDQTPVAYGIYQIYRKRYLARYLQECGMQIWVDLNVSHRMAEYNRLGVPDGYNAFFTRGVSGWIPHLELNLQMAQRISGLERPNMCVYGGGKDIEEWCREKGLVYLAEYISHTKKSPFEKLQESRKE